MLSFSRRRFSRCPSHITQPLRFFDTTALTLYIDGASVHPVLKTPRPCCLCMLLRDRRIDRCFLLTKALVHSVLKVLSWRVSVWIQTERQIDRRCPHLDRRIIRCYCLRCSSSATRPTLLGNWPSVHPTVPRVSPSVPTRPMIAPTFAILMPSVHPTVSFLFLFFFASSRLQLGSLLQLNMLNMLNMPLLIASKYIVSPQFCCK
jgi:hypothetical protein